jgi:hypothetical protein
MAWAKLSKLYLQCSLFEVCHRMYEGHFDHADGSKNLFHQLIGPVVSLDR